MVRNAAAGDDDPDNELTQMFDAQASSQNTRQPTSTHDTVHGSEDPHALKDTAQPSAEVTRMDSQADSLDTLPPPDVAGQVEYDANATQELQSLPTGDFSYDQVTATKAPATVPGVVGPGTKNGTNPGTQRNTVRSGSRASGPPDA